MAILPSVIDKILSEETDANQPISSAVAQKIGKDINALIDKFNDGFVFTSSDTFIVPDNIGRIYVFATGGGGGGAGGAGPSGITSGCGGGGGASGANGLVSYVTTPAETLTITIGTGGAGAGALTSGSAGTATTLSGTAGTLTYLGGNPGLRVDVIYGLRAGYDGKVLGNSTAFGYGFAPGGFTAALGIASGGYCAPTLYGNIAGQSSVCFAGGAAGTGFAGGGGGGASLFGSGGAGGAGGIPGLSAPAVSATSYGAGGGGGGGTTSGAGVGSGAAGVAGALIIFY